MCPRRSSRRRARSSSTPRSAAKSTRDVLALGDSREPGSDEDNAAADLVAERFGSVVAGTLAEQTVEATIDGEETELRNVLLTLPGESDHAIVVIAGRDSREGEGAPSSAAATGVLLELVNQLSVAGRNRTLILASTSGASAEGQGARELIEGLPDRNTVDAVVVISQPGFDEPFEPHLVMSGGLNGPPVGLARTAEEILRDRANLSPGKISTPAQIARYAIPAASGEQAGLIEDGLDAVALSSAGELPLPASENGRDRLDTETLARIGPALLALVSALDAAPSAPASGPGNFLWTGNNLVPGWSVGLVVLALLLPPLAVSASILARERGETAGASGARSAGRSSGGSPRWSSASASTGSPPSTSSPRAVCRTTLRGSSSGRARPSRSSWWSRSRPGSGGSSTCAGSRPRPGRYGVGAAAGLAAVAACFVVWLANPYLALLLVPLVHLVAVLGTQGRRPAALALPVLAVAALPLAVALVYVASELGWGASTPLQLAALMAGGGIGPVQAIGCVFTLLRWPPWPPRRWPR